MADIDMAGTAESLKAVEMVAGFTDHVDEDREEHAKDSLLLTPNDRAQAGSVVRAKNSQFQHIRRKQRVAQNSGHKQLGTKLVDTKESLNLRNLSATFYGQPSTTKLSSINDLKSAEDKFLAYKLAKTFHAGDLLNQLIVLS